MAGADPGDSATPVSPRQDGKREDRHQTRVDEKPSNDLQPNRVTQKDHRRTGVTTALVFYDGAKDTGRALRVRPFVKENTVLLSLGVLLRIIRRAIPPAKAFSKGNQILVGGDSRRHTEVLGSRRLPPPSRPAHGNNPHLLASLPRASRSPLSSASNRR